MRKRVRQAGFTLIEFVMVTILLGVIAVVVAQMFAQGLTVAQTEQRVTDALWQGQIAMQRMVRDIREVRSAVDISINTASEFSFTDNDGNIIDYKLSGNSLMRNTTALASGISSLQFSYLDKNGAATAGVTDIHYVVIAITVSRNNASYSLNTAVYLRDLSS